MAGRPPSEKTFANMLRVAIKEAHGEGGSKLRAVADALVTKALSGDVPAIREIADRLDGKASQSIDHSGSIAVPTGKHDLTDEQLAAIAAGSSAGTSEAEEGEE